MICHGSCSFAATMAFGQLNVPLANLKSPEEGLPRAGG
jgi:hypothetical protein